MHYSTIQLDCYFLPFFPQFTIGGEEDDDHLPDPSADTSVRQPADLKTPEDQQYRKHHHHHHHHKDKKEK